MEKVIVGMSGGVDSAVAAYLLKKQGYDVTGVTLRTWDSGEESRCCKIDTARYTARSLGIGYQVFNCVSAFEKYAVEPFVSDRLKGITLNPCIECNRYVKWEYMLYAANVLGARYIATGHYARVIKLENGRYTVQRAGDLRKDQSYMLCRLTQDQLRRTVFPLAEYTKQQVRQIADQAGIPSASDPDSQELCFISSGKPADYIRARTGNSAAPGDIVDTNGNKVGRHNGFYGYTVGQRKGLGIASTEPYYVKGINADKNEITVCREGELYAGQITCDEPYFMSVDALREGEEISADVVIRYSHTATPASISAGADGALLVRFSSPVRAPSPGQTAVFYSDQNYIVGCGKIKA